MPGANRAMPHSMHENQKNETPQWWQASWAHRGAVALLVLAAYANSIGGPFLFDGILLVRDSPGVQTLDSLTKLPRSPRHLTFATFALNYQVSGKEPWSYHVVNLAIHVANALLLYELVKRTARHARVTVVDPALLAACVAMLWACHPMLTQAVTYIYQRSESLASMFYLLTILGLARSQPGGRWGWLVVSALACFLGGFCKLIIATAPVAALAYDRVYIASSWRELLRKRWAYYGALLGAMLLNAAIIKMNARSIVSSGIGSTKSAGATPLEYLLTQPGVVLHYLKQWLVPTELCFSYNWPVAHTADRIVLPTVGIVLLLAGVGYLLWRQPRLGYAGLWFFLILAPTSSVVPIVDVAFDHRTYLPSAGLAVLSVAALAWLIRRTAPAANLGRWLLAGCFAWACVLAVATFQRNTIYASEIALWSDVLRKVPGNYDGHANLVKALGQAGRFRDAEPFAMAAVRKWPDSAVVQNNMGALLKHLGRPEEAEAYFRNSLELRRTPGTLRNLVEVLLATRPIEAVPVLEELLDLEPQDSPNQFNLGLLYERHLGDPQRAADRYRRALAADPQNDGARRRLAGLQSAE